MTPQQATAQVLPFEAPKPKPSFGAMLGAAKKAEAKPKKSTVVTIGDAPDNVKEAADVVIEAIATKKQAEGVIDVYSPVLADHVRARQDADGFKRDFHSTYAVAGFKTTAKVGYVNKYTLSGADEEHLREILGPNFATMIRSNPSVTLKAEVFEDEAKQAELMELVGDRFSDFFDVGVKLAVCEGFNKIVYQVLKPEDLENLRVYAKQYKPSIKS